MKIKQIETIQKQHARHLELGREMKPELSKYIALALVSGAKVQLKTRPEILDLCRTKIANGNYGDREIKFQELFASCPEYERAVKAWQDRDKSRRQRVAEYLQVAAPLLRRAELVEDADAEEISAALSEAARVCGLKG